MIEALKGDEIITKTGGRFKLCALIQRRLVQLMDGARPMVDRNGRSDLEVAIEEIMQGKIEPQFDATDPETIAALPQRA
jgi:DNA-directed RNA polymerase subunit omega